MLRYAMAFIKSCPIASVCVKSLSCGEFSPTTIYNRNGYSCYQIANFFKSGKSESHFSFYSLAQAVNSMVGAFSDRTGTILEDCLFRSTRENPNSFQGACAYSKLKKEPQNQRATELQP